jgi:hypothetical protein
MGIFSAFRYRPDKRRLKVNLPGKALAGLPFISIYDTF